MNSSFSRLKQKKDELRSKYRQLRTDIPIENRERFSQKICSTFINSNSFSYYDIIFCYSAKGSEVNVDLIAETALKIGKKVAFPLVLGDGKMEFRCVNSLSDLKDGTFGIKEPDPGCTLCSPGSNECTCVLVPALSFDKLGHRLGYGGGYYDRFLAEYSGSTVGIAYSQCVCDALPNGKHDICVDVLITEGGVIAVEKKH